LQYSPLTPAYVRMHHQGFMNWHLNFLMSDFSKFPCDEVGKSKETVMLFRCDHLRCIYAFILFSSDWLIIEEIEICSNWNHCIYTFLFVEKGNINHFQPSSSRLSFFPCSSEKGYLPWAIHHSWRLIPVSWHVVKWVTVNGLQV